MKHPKSPPVVFHHRMEASMLPFKHTHAHDLDEGPSEKKLLAETNQLLLILTIN